MVSDIMPVFKHEEKVLLWELIQKEITRLEQLLRSDSISPQEQEDLYLYHDIIKRMR